MSTPLLSVRNLEIGFRRDGIITPAVKSLSLDIHPGETVALVGVKWVRQTGLGIGKPRPACGQRGADR